MFPKSILFAIIFLVLTSLACGITINLPLEEITTGPTQEEKIEIPQPDAAMAELSLVFGAGELYLEPGAGEGLVSGVATYNIKDLKPTIKVENEQVQIETGSLEISGIPKLSKDIENIWDFKLGDMPIDLKINAGAYKAELDFGGLSIKSLEIGDGAAEVELNFSELNKIEMEMFRYVTGASNVKLEGLANANFSSMIFRGGAGDYRLEFSGELQRDAVVTIESGVSQVVIIVPEGVNARLYFKGGLTNVDVSGAWSGSGDTFTLEGEGPKLIINIDMGAGNLKLQTN